ncbi:MAG: helix-turn-helix domain-containing protein, partial [Clostridia bacterium]|nr:helix-turn-helix domain-containing protein [Clostridia bacterium]MBQ2567310.1 helix-turn-helix domain-containing protein [Clostridia bacterium]
PVALLNIAEFLQGEVFDQKALGEKLKPLLYAMKLTCGISNRFDDLSKAATCFRQAEIAFENGSIAMPHLNYYFFSSFTLMELISNSLGGLPAETYYPEGMKTLLEHDKTAEVSYLETLRVFLEENMNYSSAARLLYVHRTTLIDRIHRIEAETGIDLSDPNERLHLHLLIKAMELEELIQEQ